MLLEHYGDIVYFKDITRHEEHLTWLNEIIPQIYPNEPVNESQTLFSQKCKMVWQPFVIVAKTKEMECKIKPINCRKCYHPTYSSSTRATEPITVNFWFKKNSFIHQEIK
jgi:hypothetical protein